MVTETLENKNDLNLSSGPSSGERLTGLLQQTAAKSNPLGNGGRGGLGGRGGRLSMNAPNVNILIPEDSKNCSPVASVISKDSLLSPIHQIISSEKNASIMKQAVAKSNPLSGGRGSVGSLKSSPVKQNMDEMMKSSLQGSPVIAAGESVSAADPASRETFGEIKRRFEEAAAINSTVPVVGALARANSVSVGSLGLGAVASPGTAAGATQMNSPSWNKTERRQSIGVLNPQSVVTRSLFTASGRGRGPMISSSLSASSDGGESGTSIRLENFEEIKQKFESLAESKDVVPAPRLRRGSAASGNVVSSPGGVLPAGAAAVSLAAIQLPGPVVSADASKLSIGRPTLLSSHSYDSSVVADRAQAPVMLQAVARSNPLVSGGRGSSGLGRGGRIPLSSSSHDRPTDEKAAAAASSSSSAVIGRVPLNWQSNVVPSATHAAQSSPIVVGESFVEKKRNYEKSLVAAQSMNQTPSQRQQQLQLHQQHQQQLQQFMMRSDPLRTPTDPAADGSSGSAIRLSSSSSSVKSVNRHTQMMEVAVAKANPLGSRSVVAAGRGKGPNSVERTLRREGSNSPDATENLLTSPDLEAVPAARQPVSRSSSVEHATLSSRSQVALAVLTSTQAATPTTPSSAALGDVAAIVDSAPGLLSTPAFITRGHSDLKATAVPDRQLEIMQQAVSKSNPLSSGGRGAGRRVSMSRTLETPITPAGNIQSSIEMESPSETKNAPLQEVLTPFSSIARSNSTSSSKASVPPAAGWTNNNSDEAVAVGTVAASASSEDMLTTKRRQANSQNGSGDSIESMENRNPTITTSNSNASNRSNHSQGSVLSEVAASVPGSNIISPCAPDPASAPTPTSAANSVYSTIDLSGPIIRLPSADIGLDEYVGGGSGGLGHFAPQTRLGIKAPAPVSSNAVGSRQMEIMQQAVTRSNPLGGRGRRRSMVET